MTSCVWRAAMRALRVPQLRLPSSRQSLRPGGHVSSHSVRRPPVTSSRGSRPRTDCSTVRVLPGGTWVSRIAPGRIRTSPVPPGGRARPPNKEGRPLGAALDSRRVAHRYISVMTTHESRGGVNRRITPIGDVLLAC